MSNKRLIVITPNQVRIGPGPDGDVMAEILAPEQETGLIDTGLILRMTPSEARKVAALLTEKAAQAEASQRPN